MTTHAHDHDHTKQTRICRECGKAFPKHQVRTYTVIREDGDYLTTPLCDECADETAIDADLELEAEVGS